MHSFIWLLDCLLSFYKYFILHSQIIPLVALSRILELCSVRHPLSMLLEETRVCIAQVIALNISISGVRSSSCLKTLKGHIIVM